MNLVTWRANETPRVLRSAAAVRAAQRAGDVTIKAMPIVVNCPSSRALKRTGASTSCPSHCLTSTGPSGSVSERPRRHHRVQPVRVHTQNADGAAVEESARPTRNTVTVSDESVTGRCRPT